MVSEILIGSSRVWLAVFGIYTCAMVYGLLSLTNGTVERAKLSDDSPGNRMDKSESLPPVYEDDLMRVSSFNGGNIKYKVSDEGLGNLPVDFPLSNGLAKPRPALRAGNTRHNASVAIGIPSIKRQGQDYLVATVESLLRHLTPKQKQETIFVLFIGETDTDYLDDRVRDLQARFSDEMADGTLEIIAPPANLYPDWEKSVRSSFGDSIERSIWRSKQNLDQIFMMMYIYHLRSQYYLMMEDDVIATHDYMTKLMKAVEMKSNRPWIYMSFCSLGAIGKLFRRRTLPSYASFLHTFWNAKPLDWLQVDFSRSRICSYDEPEKTCFKRLKSITPEVQPSLFQHVGKISSLPGKIQKLRDRRFKQ